MEKSDPDGPGPFAFRNPDRVLTILEQAGFEDCSVDVVQENLVAAGDLSDFSHLCLSIGPAQSAAKHLEASADQIEHIHAALQDVFREFDGPDGLRIPAEINYFTARMPQKSA